MGKPGDLGVFRGKDSRQYFDKRHLGAQVAIERGEFDANRAGTDDDQAFGIASGTMASK